MMTSKERFLTALDHKQPDKVPIYDFLFSQELFEEAIGKRPETYEPEDAVRCAEKLGMDGVWIPIGGYGGYAPQYSSKDTYTDEWGTTYHHNDMSWPIDGPCGYPIKTEADYKNWDAPDPEDPGRVKPLQEAILCNENNLAILAGVLGPFTAASMLMGIEEMSVAFYTEPQLVAKLIREGSTFSMKAGIRLLEAGADAIIISDDLGYTNSLFCAPEMMRTFVLPEIKRLVDAFQRIGAKVILHCDGNINEILDDVVAMGIDGLHPLERKAKMDIGSVKAKYGKTLCPFGNVNSSSTLAYGSREEIEAEVKECLLLAAYGGGYVFGSDHSLSKGVPVQNALYMLDTVKKYRDYPLTGLK